MSKQRHTPGPWSLDKDTGTVYFEDENGEEPAICATQEKEFAPIENFDQAIANARLIAAAPDLLNALEAAYELLDSVAFVSTEGDTTALLKQIRTVIKKTRP